MAFTVTANTSTGFGISLSSPPSVTFGKVKQSGTFVDVLDRKFKTGGSFVSAVGYKIKVSGTFVDVL